jgi:glycosyltransferase involved in cell wall biosynthesis
MTDCIPITRPIRPLFVNSGLGYGGAETQLIGVARELSRRGHDPHIFLLTRVAPRSGELASCGVPITADEKRQKIDIGVIYRLRNYIRNNSIDLVHGFLFDANVYSRIAGVGLKVPVLNAERSSDYQLSPSQRVAHALTKWRVDGVVANSYAGRSFSEKLYRLPLDRTYVNWNGIDLGELDRRCRSVATNYKVEFFGLEESKMAVFVGSINETKDPGLALLVADALIDSDPSWRVVFVGASFDGSHFDYEVKAVAESANLAAELVAKHHQLRNKDKILFVGRRKDAIEIISQSNVLFSTSVREGFPNVVLEAMAVGTPVVSTNYSDIKRILRNEEWVIDSRDPREMAMAIIHVNENRKAIGSELRKWVETNATIAKSTDTLLEIYGKYI